MVPVHIYSIAVCPFAQRSRILLRLKEVPFELTEIDITKPRPDWFLALNPAGQVPMIDHDGHVLPESSVINEYLDEVFPARPVFPPDPYRRALARIFIRHVDETFVPAMYRLLMSQDDASQERRRQVALASWRWLDSFLTRHGQDGPWLFERFGIAEIAIAPFFMRYVLNSWFRAFELPEGELVRIRQLQTVCLAHPLVQETGMAEEDFIKLYADYARGYGNGAVPKGRKRSSFDPAWPLARRRMPPRGLRGGG